MAYEAKNLTQAMHLVLEALSVEEDLYKNETDLVHLVELMATGLTEGEPAAEVDKTELNTAIATAEALTETDYTVESWATLASALGAAETVAADEDATQVEVDAAKGALTGAIEALVPATPANVVG